MTEEVKTFFRRCPFCGRRFEIRLVNNKLVGGERVESNMEQGTLSAVPAAVSLESDVPMVVDVGDFSYAYRCKHCGHQWSEERFKTQNEKIDQNMTE